MLGLHRPPLPHRSTWFCNLIVVAIYYAIVWRGLKLASGHVAPNFDPTKDDVNQYENNIVNHDWNIDM